MIRLVTIWIILNLYACDSCHSNKLTERANNCDSSVILTTDKNITKDTLLYKLFKIKSEIKSNETLPNEIIMIEIIGNTIKYKVGNNVSFIDTFSQDSKRNYDYYVLKNNHNYGFGFMENKEILVLNKTIYEGTDEYFRVCLK